jgi:hypothetical protein
LEEYFPFIQENLEAYGFSMTILLNEIQFSHNDSLKIKFEVDIDPPLYANTEVNYQLEPIPFSLRSYDLPSLFAGKIHALLCRKWKNRVKGRDYFDYIWFLANSIPVNMKHLEARLRQSNTIEDSQKLTIALLKKMLFDRFEHVSYEKAKDDVRPFIRDFTSLDLWSSKFFIQITQKSLE